MVGKQLSHYHITGELGRGGMGVVYGAEDTKLQRKVAIKVLPSSALSSEDDRSRFYREARAAASLSHPNIATVFEIDEAVPEGAPADELRPFIAMELVEGQTLQQRVDEGPFKLEEAIEIASQIASGLEAAHEKDIVHRDIKSGNVMLTAKGRAKILDFGLAQTAASTKLTRMGSTLGTIAYMSPEQARGEEVDGRSDLWSLGVILYEMISGRSPFPGDYEQAAVYSILNEDPEPLTAIRTGVPMGVEWIVSKCLAKNAADRYQNAGDLLVDLRNVDLAAPGLSRVSGAASVRQATVAPSASSGSKNGITVPPAVLIGGGAVLIVMTWILASLFSGAPDSESRRSTALTIDLLDESGNPIRLSSLNGLSALLSPDGSTVVFRAAENSVPKLFVREIDSYFARAIEGTDYVRNMAFSPDGEWLAFCTDRYLSKMSLDGGLPIPLAEIGGFLACRGLSWRSNESLVFVPTTGTGLFEVDADGDNLRQLTVPDRSGGETDHRFPHVLPSGKGVLFTIKTENLKSFDDSTIGLYDFESGEITELFRGGTNASVVGSDVLLYSRNESLMAVRFDERDRQVTGRHIMVVDSVYSEFMSGSSDYSVSETGDLLFNGSGILSTQNLVYRTRDEVLMRFDSTRGVTINHRFSPSGDRAAVRVTGANDEIALLRMDRPELVSLPGEGNNMSPIWTPDGNWITHTSDRTGTWAIYNQSVSSDSVRLLVDAEMVDRVGGWTPDGSQLVFSVADSDTGLDIWMFDEADGGMASSLIATDEDEFDPALSLDGTLLAFAVIDASGLTSVNVARYPDVTDRMRVTAQVEQTDLPSGFRWDANGYLYYNYKNTLRRTRINADGNLSSSEPEEVLPYVAPPGFAVSSDGERFIVHEKPERENLATGRATGMRVSYYYPHLRLITDWLPGVRERLEAQE